MKNRYMANVEYLTVGLEHAKVEIEVFVNLGCPYSATFFEVAEEVIKPYTDSGRAKLIIKHVDKTKGQLLRGTVANNYVDHNNPVEGFYTMKKLFNTQDKWVHSFKETLDMCEGTLGLPEKTAAYERGAAVMEEFTARGLKTVPTVFIDGELLEYSAKEQSNEELAQIITERIESLK